MPPETRRRLGLPPILSFGVQSARVRDPRGPRDATLIVAPSMLPETTRPRRWGLFAPVYALRREGTWGCGDLTALEQLGRWAASRGASVIATLPILPAFLEPPSEVSPYRPVTQRFWNEVLLDVPRTPEFRRSASLSRRVRSRGFRRTIDRLERRDRVDFVGVARLKREVIERLWVEFERAPASRRRAFRSFVDRSPDLEAYARFRARGAADPGAVAAYHRFAQWLVDEQLRDVAGRLRRLGVEPLLDLPLGTHPRGFDVVEMPELFAADVHTGSPPDPGVPGGQDWGLPPLRPAALRRAGFRPLVAALRHAFSVAGIVRIDHILGVHRLFWIPEGRPAREGAYVRYPSTELYAVLRAEAARAGGALVGEDLGTVPPGLRRNLARQGFLSLYVAQLEWDGPGPHRAVPANAVASLNTHDQSPFAAYWEARKGRTAPSPDRGPFPSTALTHEEALRVALERLARSPARLLLVNVEDLWGETVPQNVPGEAADHFTRRCRVDLAELRSSRFAAELLSTIAASRALGMDDEPPPRNSGSSAVRQVPLGTLGPHRTR